MSAGLCPACLITTALSQDDAPCPYRVLAPIDEDAAGVTYFAQGLNGARGYVALKVHDRHRHLEAVLDRYERWKPALEQVDHEHIARLVDVGVTAEGLLVRGKRIRRRMAFERARIVWAERREPRHDASPIDRCY